MYVNCASILLMTILILGRKNSSVIFVSVISVVYSTKNRVCCVLLSDKITSRSTYGRFSWYFAGWLCQTAAVFTVNLFVASMLKMPLSFFVLHNKWSYPHNLFVCLFLYCCVCYNVGICNWISETVQEWRVVLMKSIRSLNKTEGLLFYP